MALVLIALSCAARTPVRAPSLSTETFRPVEILPYRLQVGDTIGVKFWGNMELDQELVIRPDGMISLPFLDEVEAAGLTPGELDAKLSQLYTAELATPDITVIVRNVVGQEFFISGEVRNEGAFPVEGGITLYQGIQRAGGFTVDARRQEVIVIRTLADEERIAAKIDLMPLQTGLDPKADIRLQARDIIFVPRVKVVALSDFLDRYFYDLLPIRAVRDIQFITR